MSQAEVKAGFTAGAIDGWRTRDLGSRLTRDLKRLDAVLQVRAGLAALDHAATEQEQNDVEPVKTSQRRGRRRQQATPIVKSDHAHYWNIPPSSGGAPVGKCRICGATKLFSNTGDVDDIDYRWRTREAQALEEEQNAW